MSGARYAVILAGGRGERFWPLSRAQRPKQLLSLVGDRSLLAQAADRLDGLVPNERIYVITNADLVDASRKAAPEVPPENIVGEPVGRDTAPAVALATALLKARDPDAVFAILTADHVIGELPLFRTTLRQAMDLAAAGPELVTIGIRPAEPSTAYGYIERAEAMGERDGIRFFRGKRFVEKPDRAKAEEYLASERYLWNSGMFIWSVKTIQDALMQHRPPLGQLVDRLASAVGRSDFADVLAREYQAVEKISIDYAVMENARNFVVAEGRFPWDDVGSWPALANHFPADSDGNVVVGSCASHEAARNIVYSRDRLTALVGVEDLIVVQAEDVTLVCRREHAQDVKKLLAQLRKAGRSEIL